MIQLPPKPKVGQQVRAVDAGMVIDGVRELERQLIFPGRRPKKHLGDEAGGNRFPNRIRALDAEADKQWAIDNGGTLAGTDPVSLFLIAVQDAIDDEYTAQCIVVEPNRMLAEIADASPAAPAGENSGIWLIPAPKLVVIHQAFFGVWVEIGRKFAFDASENDFLATPKVLAHPVETVVTSEDEDFDLDTLETYTPATVNNATGTASITYIDSGARTVILGRVFLPSSDAVNVTGAPVIEQNISGVAKLAWNVAPKLISLYSELGSLGVDFKIYPTVLISDGLEPISLNSNATERWMMFAPNQQLYGRPEALTVLTSTSGVRIAPPAIGGFDGVGTSEAYMWELFSSGLSMWNSSTPGELTVELTRANAALELTDWSAPNTRVRLDSYSNYVKGQEWGATESWIDLWKLSADGLVLTDLEEVKRAEITLEENDTLLGVYPQDEGGYAMMRGGGSIELYRGAPNADALGYVYLNPTLLDLESDDGGSIVLNALGVPSGTIAQFIALNPITSIDFVNQTWTTGNIMVLGYSYTP